MKSKINEHIKELRSLLIENDNWSERYATPNTRLTCMKLFNCTVEGYQSMSNEAFALAMIAQNGNSLCFIPKDVWKAVKEEATKMLTLQMVAETFPPLKANKQFSLVVDNDNELPGWQPLALFLAKGYERLKYWVDYNDSSRDNYDLCGYPSADEIDADSEQILDETMPWNPHNWISAESIGIDSSRSSCELEIDIPSLSIKVVGWVEKRVDFSGNIRLGCQDSDNTTVEHIIQDVFQRSTPHISYPA